MRILEVEFLIITMKSINGKKQLDSQQCIPRNKFAVVVVFFKISLFYAFSITKEIPFS